MLDIWGYLFLIIIKLNKWFNGHVEQVEHAARVIRNLFDVERGRQCDSFYQRQQGAVVDSHPGHRLTVDLVQDVKWDQEALFPRQPGQQGRRVLLPHQPVRQAGGTVSTQIWQIWRRLYVLQLSFISSSYLWISWSPSKTLKRVTSDTLTFPLKRQLWLREKMAVDVKQTHFLG